MKRIDAHAHIGYTGGWANVGITGEELIAQMDQYEIEMTALCAEDNEVTYQMMQKYVMNTELMLIFRYSETLQRLMMH